MKPIKHLNVPQACSQDWNQMTATGSGRHCQSCAKTVVDFTRMSNNEIIGYLSVNRHVCARIGEQQINSVNVQLAGQQPQSKGGWAKWVMAASLFVSTAYSRANAQGVTHPTEQTDSNYAQAAAFPLGKIAFPDSAGYQVVTGKVIDGNDNEPLPGATIKINGGNTGTLTDAKGNFRLRVPISVKTLKVTFLGFESTVIEIKKTGKVLKVKLKENTIMLGGMGVTRPTLMKRLYAKFVHTSIKGMFNREV